MGYDIEQIKCAQEIIATLINNKGTLEKSHFPKQYANYSDPFVKNIVDEQIKELDCYIIQHNKAIYMSPFMNNTRVGFTTSKLKDKLCSGNVIDEEYYLAEFVILVLILMFFEKNNYTEKSREYVRVEDLMNSVIKNLNTGVVNNRDKDPDEMIADFEKMYNKFESLKNEVDGTTKTTKEGFVKNIMNFLKAQNLVSLRDDKIFITEKMEALVSNILIKKSNLHEITAILKNGGNE